MAGKEVVSTGVDNLLALVKERHEISVPDAAKALNVSPATVESWAAFLEEEKLLGLKYKFTTPFLFAVSEAKPVVKKAVGFKELFAHAPPPPPAPVRPAIREVVLPAADTGISREQPGEGMHGDDYSSLREEYENLPLEFTKKREELLSKMLALNKEYILNLDKVARSTAAKASADIKALASKAAGFAGKGDINSVVSSFSSMRELFKAIPDSLPAEKLTAEKCLLEVQEGIVALQQKLSSAGIKADVGRILALVPKLESLVEAQNLDEAAKVYAQINALRKGIPAGFLEERAAVENKLLPLYNRMINLQLELSRKRMAELKAQILRLLGEVHLGIESHKFAEAFKAYDSARALYSRLPFGFVAEKAELQAKLLAVLRSLLELKSSLLSSDSAKKSEKIKALIGAAEENLRSAKTDVAKKIYKEMGYLFSSLPKGFASPELEAGVIELYYKLLASLESSLMKQGEQERYLDLLHRLIRNHELIRHKEFDLMLVNAEEILKLYRELPDAVRRPELADAVSRVDDEAKLFKEVSSLKKAPKGDAARVKALLDSVYGIYSKLVVKCPEDSELFSFIKGVYISQLSELAKKG